VASTHLGDNFSWAHPDDGVVCLLDTFWVISSDAEQVSDLDGRADRSQSRVRVMVHTVPV